MVSGRLRDGSTLVATLVPLKARVARRGILLIIQSVAAGDSGVHGLESIRS